MFAKNLQLLRLKKHWSQKQLAAYCGLTPMSICNYENGKRYPNEEVLNKLAEVLEVTPSVLTAQLGVNNYFYYSRPFCNKAMTDFEWKFLSTDVVNYFGYLFRVAERVGGRVWPEKIMGHRLLYCEDLGKNILMVTG